VNATEAGCDGADARLLHPVDLDVEPVSLGRALRPAQPVGVFGAGTASVRLAGSLGRNCG